MLADRNVALRCLLAKVTHAMRTLMLRVLRASIHQTWLLLDSAPNEILLLSVRTRVAQLGVQ